MSIVSNNLKYLRRLNGLTQEQFARRIGIKRSLLGAYEEARANPNLDNLLMIAKVFGVTVDQMLKHDLRKVRETPDLTGQGLSSLLKSTNETSPQVEEKSFAEEKQPSYSEEPKSLSSIVDKYYRSENSINLVAQKVVPKSVFSEPPSPVVEPPTPKVVHSEPPMANYYQFSTIQLVRQSQFSEYVQRHQQLDFLRALPVFNLPGLPKGDYRAFEAGDDFTFPGGLLIGAFVKNWFEIQDGKHYVLVTKNHGILYRRVYNQLNIKGILIVSSDLEYITSTEFTIKEVVEVWEMKAFVSQTLPTPTLSLHRISQLVEELQQELERVKR
ncbi:MAG: helix-turn-helix transcriptional regulator [Spirosomataceae bacterium]